MAASSEFFHALFTKETWSKTGELIECESVSVIATLSFVFLEITINGISEGIKHLLNFIYTAKLELTLSNVQEILNAANYFQCQLVIDACHNFLESEIDTENSIDMLIIAENFSLPSLRDNILKFICGHISEISKSKELFRLQGYQIEQLLACDFAVDCTENEILRVALDWIRKSDEKINFHKILENINWKEVSVNEVERNLKALDVRRHDELYNAVWSFLVPTKLQVENEYKLLNNRGMALALIKIGGFELTGLTNEITYAFPSSGNSRSVIEGPWKVLTEVPHVKQGAFGIAVLNNCIYVIGGSYDISLESEDVHPFGFRYDPLTSEWNTLKPMNFDRCRFSLNVSGDSLIAVGGYSEGIFDRLEDQAVSSVEKYNPERDEWIMLKPMPEYRSRHAGASYKNKLFISGGVDQFGNVMDSFFEYDLTTDEWEKRANITPRADHVMLRFEKKIYLCGGWEEVDGQRRLLSAIDCFNCETSTISVVTHIPTPRFHAGIAIFNNKIYFVGGFAADGNLFQPTRKPNQFVS